MSFIFTDKESCTSKLSVLQGNYCNISARSLIKQALCNDGLFFNVFALMGSKDEKVKTKVRNLVKAQVFLCMAEVSNIPLRVKLFLRITTLSTVVVDFAVL